MLLGYGDFIVDWAISGSAAGATFDAPTDGSGLIDGRTGEVQACTWIGGTQTTASYVQLTGSISSPLDSSTPAIGVVGIANVIGLPEGTKIVIGSVNQRLVMGERRELSAWLLPLTNGNTVTIRIMNDVNGSASIAAATQFAIGEIFVGRLIQLPALVQSPSNDLQDPTQFNRTAGGQLRQLMRKNYRICSRTLGPFTITDAFGGSESSINDGGHAAGKIDVQGLRSLLSTSALCAVCYAEAPSSGASGVTTTSGITYDKDFMQRNWMCARPSLAGQIVDSSAPYWNWSPQFMEAT